MVRKSFREKCFVCGVRVGFILPRDWSLHCEAQCGRCGARKRNSDTAQTILMACLGETDSCLKDSVSELSRIHLT
jgi:hypothetical protein